MTQFDLTPFYCSAIGLDRMASLFERRFQLADFIKIKSADLKDGLLHINLVREIHEAMKPRKIEINQSGNLMELKKGKRP